MKRGTLLYAIAAYDYLAGELASLGDAVRGSLERSRFPDGERYLRVLDDVNDCDVTVVGGTGTVLVSGGTVTVSVITVVVVSGGSVSVVGGIVGSIGTVVVVGVFSVVDVTGFPHRPR